MKSEIFIIVVISLYYRFFYRQDKTSQETNKYFMIFVGIYVLLWYFMKYHKSFVYKVALNMNNTEKRNYYDLLPFDNNVNQRQIIQQQMVNNHLINNQMINQGRMFNDREFIQERYRTDQRL